MAAINFNPQPLFYFINAQPVWVRYFFALMTVLAATMATLTFSVMAERAVFLLFLFAVILSSFWMGAAQGVFALMSSLLMANSVILAPAWDSRPIDTLIMNTGFCLVSGAIILTTHVHRCLGKALRESRQQLSHALYIGKIGSWRLNPQLDEFIWSEESHRIFGLPKGTAMAYQAFLDIVHADDREFVDRKWWACLRGETYDIEHRIVVAGEVKWVREQAMLEFGKNGRLLGGFGTTQDITDRKLNEAALRESQMRYAGMVESAMDAIIVFDATNTLLLFNPAAEKMFGCAAEEAIDGPIERFFPEFHLANGFVTPGTENPGNLAQHIGKWDAVKGLRGNGEEFLAEAALSGASLAAGNVFTLIVRDVIERVRAEAALKERFRLQDLLAKVAATVPGVVCSIRLRPDGSASMPFASPAFKTLSGLDPAQVAEDFTLVFAGIHTDDLGLVQETIAESARALRPWRGSFRYRHPTKGEIWVEGRSMPVPEQDGGILWHGYVHDVTEPKRFAEALAEKEAFVRDVLNSLPEQVVVLDAQGVVSLVNEPWERFALKNGGLPAKVSVGAHYLDVCQRASAAGDPDAGLALAGLAEEWANGCRIRYF